MRSTNHKLIFKIPGLTLTNQIMRHPCICTRFPKIACSSQHRFSLWKKIVFPFFLCISSSCLKIWVILTSRSVHNGHKYTAKSVVGLRSFFESCVKLSKITHMVCAFRRRNIPLCSVYNWNSRWCCKNIVFIRLDCSTFCDGCFVCVDTIYTERWCRLHRSE